MVQETLIGEPSDYLDEALRTAFQARHLAVPMSAAFAVPADWTVRVALRELEARHFDQAPVTKGGAITGFVLRPRLLARAPDETIEAVQRAIGPGNIVSANAPVPALLEWIEDEGFLFVLEGRALVGFMTVSDFNKQPARGYLYLLIGTVETRLSELLRQRFAGNLIEALDHLPPNRRAYLVRQYDQDVRDNVEADEIAVLGFSDLVAVVLNDPALRDLVGAIAPRLDLARRGLIEMRDAVMHTNLTLVTQKQSLMDLRRCELLLRELAGLRVG